jgi:flagellar protein FlbT
MALKIILKPGEKIIVGGAVITNGTSPASLIIENSVPILRQKDIIAKERANSPCKRIYLVIQLMYIDGANLAVHHNTYWTLVKEVIKAAPSTLPIIDRISSFILRNEYYQALKQAKKLIDYEEEAIGHVRRSAGNL